MSQPAVKKIKGQLINILNFARGKSVYVSVSLYGESGIPIKMYLQSNKLNFIFEPTVH